MVIAETKVKDAVVIFIKKLIVIINIYNIADYIKSLGAVTKQYILPAVLCFIYISKHFPFSGESLPWLCAMARRTRRTTKAFDVKFGDKMYKAPEKRTKIW